MKQRHFAVIVFVSILAACGIETAAESAGAPLAGPNLPSGEDGVKEPVGTYESTTSGPGKIGRLVLMADGTAHVELIVACRGGLLPCPPAVIDSTYKLTEADGVKRLELFDQETLLRAYDYRYDGHALEIAEAWTAEWQSLAPAPAWCSVAPQCEHQGLSQPGFAGQWACVSNTCQFKPTDRGLDPAP